jgi:hypothetical protein
MKRTYFLTIASLVYATLQPMAAWGQNTDDTPKPSARTIARIFWQEMESQSLRWGDLQRTGNDWRLEANSIEGFPALAPETQSLVQMESLDNMLVTGVHDMDRGTIGSGWVAIQSGVSLEEHGDHAHAHFDDAPRVIAKQLDQNQGNPAHLYRYGGKIYLANDAKDGFTMLESVTDGSSRPSLVTRFLSGGGKHITLAVVENRVCYATWADREGENAGRIDVVSLDSTKPIANPKIVLPVGGLHGATSNSGSVFFAPAAGIYVLPTDGHGGTQTNLDPIHVDLGKDPETDKPFRTGAFVNHRQWVLFQFGSGEHSQLGLIDAAQTKPSLRSISIPTEPGLSLSSPRCVVAANGKEYAWLVQHRKDSESVEKLIAVDLDPNGDRDLSDAAVMRSVELGNSRIDGHSGYHEISFLPNGRLACISNPGDATLWILSVHSLEVLAKLNVGGAPTRLLSFGE